MLKARCIYTYVFETEPIADADILNMSKYEKIPHPFVLEPPEEEKTVYPAGSAISFNLIVVGKAVEYAPYFVFTFLELGKKGIGKKRGRYSISEIKDLEAGLTVFTHEDQTLSEIHSSELNIPETIVPGNGIREVTLRIKTPLRLKFRRDLVFDLKFHVLIRNLMRRITLIYYFHCERRKPGWDAKDFIRLAEKVRTTTANIRWFDWERYSSRQESRLKMGGIVGEITFQGDLNPFMPILKAGEILHAGKGTSFGLGRYEIAEIP